MHRTHRWVVIVFVVALPVSAGFAAGGCARWFGWSSQVTAEPQQDDLPRFLLADPADSSATDAIVVVQMQFDVLRVELPADTIHHSQKIWNHVDELSADPTLTALLRRNGFRMGTASTDAWPAMRAVFEACQARVLRAAQVVQRGLPLTLELDSIEEDEPIFLLTADNRMVGRTLHRGRKYLHLDYATNVDDRSTVTIQITPEVHLLGSPTFGLGESGIVRRNHEYQGLVFNELSNTLEVAAGRFLVIGPDTDGSSRLTVGRRFLTRKHEGRLWETVLCITPQPFRTEVAQR
jgi:hypothetical protein